MRFTMNDLPEVSRGKIIDIFQGNMANMADLTAQAKQAHWNVEGMDFIALHKLFDDIYGAAAEYTDTLAERIVQLGGVAQGTIQATYKATQLPEYPIGIVKCEDHVRALAKSMVEVIKCVRCGIDETAKLGDQGSSNLLTDMINGLEKYLLFLDAHLRA